MELHINPFEKKSVGQISDIEPKRFCSERKI